MPTSAATLVARTRRYVRDLPELDQLNASLASGSTSFTVTDGTQYAADQYLEIDQETLLITAVATNTLTVRRGVWGSTAASHASATTILASPRFYFMDYLDALNSALKASFANGFLYQDVVDETLTTASNTYEYTIPSVNGTPLRYVYDIGLKEPGDFVFRYGRNWSLVPGASPVFRFRYEPVAASTIRVRGIAPFPDLTSAADTLSAQFPVAAEEFLKVYAGQTLLASGLRWRTARDSGAVDSREQANSLSGVAAIERLAWQESQALLASLALPPWPRHLKRVF